MSNAHRPLLEQTSQIKRLDCLDQGRNDQLTSTSKIFISRENFKVALSGKIFIPKIERKGEGGWWVKALHSESGFQFKPH